MSVQQQGPLTGVVAIVRLRETEPDDAVVAALSTGGVRLAEITLTSPGALAAIRRWSAREDVAAGAGTVRTVADARAAIEAGARFLVTPVTVPDVLALARDAGVPVACGALTPTEIETAWRHGAAVVKVFPVSAVGGAAYLRAVREPLDDVPLLPTGGVRWEDVAGYARIGCAGVGVGASLVSEDLVAAGRWETITERAKAFTAAWRDGRGLDA
ncbi:bifunctional 4-hydroxy-2-oxoglutarate aldolase/2-dehydro-3-deoxy-phosphogluconate aldolase [Rhizohabitans arisaemae]|uniref:bifunctional 4-hydroxy-2-oxoglutarate aldolase/2-dehydro-3-deoxy-phosphogluconate aldolase n=1 Tax=Rhizohabitans arisaemae TaxID=2720610 RepID=UPI0024B0A9A6|nr:bifunctional 4-hydroxy-2-oxoglutarate aldolase/2-dehydro-3-deoxy-phosphogluconate aldolase [Rhizohabitans arisaemae]